MFQATLCPSSGEQDGVLLHMVFCTVTVLQCRTPYAVIHDLVLLMMGIMMPETCWDRSLIIKIGLVASCWFLSLHPTFRDARSQEPKTCVRLYYRHFIFYIIFWDRPFYFSVYANVSVQQCYGQSDESLFSNSHSYIWPTQPFRLNPMHFYSYLQTDMTVRLIVYCLKNLSR